MCSISMLDSTVPFYDNRLLCICAKRSHWSGWASLAHLRKKDASSHPDWQCEEMLDLPIGVRLAM